MLQEAQNEVLKRVLVAFRQRFTPGGRVLWVTEETEPILSYKDGLLELGVRVGQHHDLPNVVIHAPEKDRLALIDVADLRGQMTLKRRQGLAEAFGECKVDLIFVTAFANRREFQHSLSEVPWETVVWFADEPNHMVHFDGARLFGPR